MTHLQRLLSCELLLQSPREGGRVSALAVRAADGAHVLHEARAAHAFREDRLRRIAHACQYSFPACQGSGWEQAPTHNILGGHT